MTTKRICVIGAGPSGLTCVKQCLDEGFEVVCYDKTDAVGGLWRYRDEDVDGLPSVAKTTIINTSKEMSAFSDFPPPTEFPNFMENKLMFNYFEQYATHYKLKPHIRQLHEVVSVAFNDDYDNTGKWKVKARNLTSDEVTEEVFDGVLACSGHHVTPHIPEFPGQSEFKGKIIHTHSYKKPVGMDDKVVVVVGIGNSGVDAVVELARVCTQVYLSTRRGSWVTYRVGLNGTPYDMVYNSRIIANILNWLPYNVGCHLGERLLNSYFDHEKYGLKPKHRLFSQHPTVNDAISNAILSGRVRVRKNIARFTENGVVFEGQSNETKCDVVVLATGYKIAFPYLDHSVMPIVNNQVRLYKNVFQPNLRHPQTLAVIGLIQPVGCIFPISEMQARWFVQLMKGKVSLPKVSEMNMEIDKDLEKIKQRYYGSGRHTIQVDYIPYMDEIATLIGAKPNLTWYMLTDPKLWYHLFFGPCVPYQYRLQGPHTWPGARDAILNVYKRCFEALKC